MKPGQIYRIHNIPVIITKTTPDIIYYNMIGLSLENEMYLMISSFKAITTYVKSDNTKLGILFLGVRWK